MSKYVLGADIQAEPMDEFEYQSLMGYVRHGDVNREGFICRYFKRHEIVHTNWMPKEQFEELFVIV